MTAKFNVFLGMEEVKKKTFNVKLITTRNE